MAKQILNVHEARNITKESQGFFETCLDRCQECIIDAAKRGQFETTMPSFGDAKIEERVIEHLRMVCGYSVEEDKVYRLNGTIIKWM